MIKQNNIVYFLIRVIAWTSLSWTLCNRSLGAVCVHVQFDTRRLVFTLNCSKGKVSVFINDLILRSSIICDITESFEVDFTVTGDILSAAEKL